MLHSDLEYTQVHLRPVASRVAKPGQKGRHGSSHGHSRHDSHDGDGDDHELHEHPVQKTKGGKILDLPVFTKNEAATNFELFYDLFFVANLNVFTTIHEISTVEQLYSFIGFLTLLWTTWLSVTIWDVRFTADSVFERCARGVHLGVMVGFAEIGTSFNPDDQIKAIFQTMSLFLAVSRFTLCLQYSLTTWQVRRYVDGWRPMAVSAALCLAASAVYLGITFRYADYKSSRVYVVWYVVGVLEVAVHLGFSQLSRVLSFVGTHLGERMNLLTLIILGEGAIILSKNVGLLVQDTYVKGDQAVWSAQLIGIVIAATALIYVVFQLYFDFFHHDEHGDSMYEAHQVWWTSIHLPLHVALVLFLEGMGKFVIWARILEDTEKWLPQLERAMFGLSSATAAEGGSNSNNPSSEDVAKSVEDFMAGFLKQYKAEDVAETNESLEEVYKGIRAIPEALWANVDPAQDGYGDAMRDFLELVSTVVNNIFYAFKILAPEGKEREEIPPDAEHLQTEIFLAITHRFSLIFVYTFVCAGVVLLILTILHVLSKHKGWSPWNVARTAFCIVVALGLSLTAALVVDVDAADSYFRSSMMVPTLTLAYFAVLILSHAPHPTFFGMGRYDKVAGGALGGNSSGSNHNKEYKAAAAVDPEMLPLTDMRASMGGHHQRNNFSVSTAPGFKDNAYAAAYGQSGAAATGGGGERGGAMARESSTTTAYAPTTTVYSDSPPGNGAYDPHPQQALTQVRTPRHSDVESSSGGGGGGGYGHHRRSSSAQMMMMGSPGSYEGAQLAPQDWEAHHR